jgi:hypothetical protein
VAVLRVLRSGTFSKRENFFDPIVGFRGKFELGKTWKGSELNPAVAETAMGKPPFKASDGGRIDILRELEEITQSEFEQGSET